MTELVFGLAVVVIAAVLLHAVLTEPVAVVVNGEEEDEVLFV